MAAAVRKVARIRIRPVPYWPLYDINTSFEDYTRISTIPADDAANSLIAGQGM